MPRAAAAVNASLAASRSTASRLPELPRDQGRLTFKAERSGQAKSPLNGRGAGSAMGQVPPVDDCKPGVAALFDAFPQRIVKVGPKRPLREPGHPRNEMVIVRSGILSKSVIDCLGRRQIVALLYPGECIVPWNGSASYAIQAIGSAEIAICRAEDFHGIVSADPNLQQHLWQLLRRDNAIACEWLAGRGLRDAKGRVAHLLIEAATRMGDASKGRMINPFTQVQIADITGQTSVNVNRMLGILERDGLIERSGREIVFTGWAELNRIASFKPDYLA